MGKKPERDVAGKELVQIWKVVDEEKVSGREWADQDILRLYPATKR